MITVGMNYQIIKGKETEFEAVFGKVLEIMRAMPGHAKTNLYRDVADANSYIIISEWTAKDQFQSFIASEQFRNVANWGKSNILASQPRHQIYGEESSTPQPPRGCPAHAGGQAG